MKPKSPEYIDPVTNLPVEPGAAKLQLQRATHGDSKQPHYAQLELACRLRLDEERLGEDAIGDPPAPIRYH